MITANKSSKEPKNVCEACGSNFICQANNIENCFCNKIVLTPEVLQQMKTKFQHCLCESCLSKLKMG